MLSMLQVVRFCRIESRGYFSSPSWVPLLLRMAGIALGALFRSTSYQRNETELVIIVTPYVVRPVADGPSLKLPTDGLAPASDVERVFMDRLSKAYPPGAANAIGLNGARLRGDAGFVFQ